MANVYDAASWRVVKIITPRGNDRDALAVETLLGTLSGADPFALEIIGTRTERMFVVRGVAGAVERVLNQLRAAYPQVELRTLDPADDPARAFAEARMVRELRLREPAYLPIRTHLSRGGRGTYDDYKAAADPMLGVLGAMDALEAGEGVVVQYSLAPAGDDWSRYWRGAAQDVRERTKLTGSALAAPFLVLGGAVFLILGLCALLVATLVALPLWSTLTAILSMLIGAVLIYARTRLPSPPDPLLIAQKVNQAAFKVRVRLFVYGESDERAERRMEALVAAFRAYNLAGGNGFVFVDKDGRAVAADGASQIDQNQGGLFRRMRVGAVVPILSMSEIAALWHLPHAESGVQGVSYTNAKHIAPLPHQVAHGVHVGTASRNGETFPVRIPRESLRGHIALVAKTRAGKSNMMAMLARDCLQADPEAALIVIDPHRSLAQHLAGLTPAARRDNTIYWDLSDRERPFGLNLIDRRAQFEHRQSGADAGAGSGAALGAGEMHVDKRMDDIVSALHAIWPDNWGPRMETFLRGPLATLAHANEALIEAFAFSEWYDAARAALQSIRSEIATGLRDEASYVKLREIGARLKTVRRPTRPSYARLYDAGVAAFAAFDAASRRLVPNASGAVAASAGDERAERAERAAAQKAFFDAARAIYAALVSEPDKRGERRQERASGLALRRYQAGRSAGRDRDHDRPLQFTLLDLEPLLMSAAMRAQVLSTLKADAHGHLKSWWASGHDVYAASNMRLLLEMITPVTTKMTRFSLSDIARRIFGQPDTTIDLEQVIDGGGALLIDLAAGVVGQETAALVGAAIVNWVANILFARQEGAPRDARGKPRRVVIVIDEFQSIPGVDYPFLLSELAKYGAQLIMGTQSLGLLNRANPEARAAWLDNTDALFVFRCGADDARDMADELNVSDEDTFTVRAPNLVGLQDHACYVRARDAEGHPRVFRIDTLKAPDPDAATFAAVRERSRARYGRDREQVDAVLRRAAELRPPPDLISERPGFSRMQSGFGAGAEAGAGANADGNQVEGHSKEALGQLVVSAEDLAAVADGDASGGVQ